MLTQHFLHFLSVFDLLYLGKFSLKNIKLYHFLGQFFELFLLVLFIFAFEKVGKSAFLAYKGFDLSMADFGWLSPFPPGDLLRSFYMLFLTSSSRFGQIFSLLLFFWGSEANTPGLDVISTKLPPNLHVRYSRFTFISNSARSSLT